MIITKINRNCIFFFNFLFVTFHSGEINQIQVHVLQSGYLKSLSVVFALKINAVNR